MIPNILSIAGSDCSGGAGIQADIKAISANGGYAMSVITALTAQNTQSVNAVALTSPAMIKAQFDAIYDDVQIDAVKIGMLGDAEIIQTVADCVRKLNCPIVLDPVMVAKSGDRLLQAAAINALREALIPLATIITPNLPEAADLLGEKAATTLAEMQHQAPTLRKLGAQAILLKGGHLGSETSPDLLITASGITEFLGKRIATKNTHGTGCTLSSALATYLGKGENLETAVQSAKDYLSHAIAHANELNVGHGHGPVNHFA